MRTSILRALVAVIASRRPIAVVALVAGIVAAVGYWVVTPERYTAASTVVLDPVGAAGGSTDALLRTELDLLRSERVAQRVVENLRMADSAAARTLLLESGDTRHTLPEFLALHLIEHVRAEPAGDSGLVLVSFSARDPQFAAEVANAYPQAYGEVSLEMRASAIRTGVERAGRDLALLRVHLEQARGRHVRPDGGGLDSVTARAGEQLAHLARLALQSPQVGLAAVPHDDAATAAAPSASAVAVAPISPIEMGAAGDASSEDATPERDLRVAQQNLERAEERLARLSAESIGAPFPAHLLVAAAVPHASSKPTLPVCVAIGALGGLLLGLIGTLLSEALDRRVRRVEDVTRNLGIVVLGSLPATR